MTRRPVPAHEKRQNVGLRLHPTTIQRLDEIATYFKNIRAANPLLPFNYPESRTEVMEWMLREGALDVIQRALIWNRLETPDQRQGDFERLTNVHFWSMLVTEVRNSGDAIPESWLPLEWPPRPTSSSNPGTTEVEP